MPLTEHDLLEKLNEHPEITTLSELAELVSRNRIYLQHRFGESETYSDIKATLRQRRRAFTLAYKKQLMEKLR